MGAGGGAYLIFSNDHFFLSLPLFPSFKSEGRKALGL